MGRRELGHSFTRILEVDMTFPNFDPTKIEFMASTLEGWLKSLPENSKLRVFHTNSDGVQTTWLEGPNNTVFIVSEDNK